ncbi:MAG: TonB-dependent receptor [Hyphomonas sp. BRH_c22]|uniref:TonB-dependent receptor n=1 Tax=Hyphomonas sp. BRH_c22 TaxID=1629710 RepID=UPI0005F1A14C|nr:TonB-dependent receptor [Hyphomonas sp. BRH_c22]KJS39085.1 MAG: TonB-dependent receptor [Hyphomonas sp. BRH_c22]
MNFKKMLALSASVAVFAAGSAIAQEADAAPARESAVDRILGTVTVTATKKANVENVQDVPLAVTAFNSDTLDALKVNDLQGLSYSTPNVSLEDVGTSKGVANFSIRGLGINSSIPSVDPTVGVFVDGVYLGVNSGVVLDLFDLDSVEILRGPQGLLFGRNTTGGAVLINTGNPTDEFRYKARATVETPIDDGRGGPNTTLQATVSGPLVQDKLNGKLGIYHNFDDGYFKNLATDDNLGESHTTIVRGALEWMPTEDLTFLGKVENFQTEGDGPNGQNRGFYDRGSFDIAINNPGFLKNDTTFATLRTDLDVDFGNGTITNIIGYREVDSTTSADIDATPLTLFHSGSEFAQEQFSEELRYSGTFDKADVTVGGFYFTQEVGYTERRDLSTTRPATFPADLDWEFNGGGRQDHTVYGIFGQVDYAFTEKLTGIFGLRYGYEEKDVDITYLRPRPNCSVVNATCPTTGTNPYITGEPNGFTDKEDWSEVTPKLGVQYFHTDDTQFYGTYTKGFRSGGYNFRITNALAFEALFPPTGSRAFDAEKVDSFEIGMKHTTSDGRGQLNAAVFLNDIKDMQRELNLSSPTSGVAQTIINTADAEILGLELEGRYALTDSFLVTANIGLIDAEYTKVIYDISGDGVVDGDDLALALPRVPEATYGFALIHDYDMADRGSLVSRLTFQHRDKNAFTDNNFGWMSAADQLDANLTWNTPMDGVSVSLFGKNLIDESIAGGDTQVPFDGALAGFAPGGENNSTGVDVPFGANPSAGTFSPLQKGRLIGIEFTISR